MGKGAQSSTIHAAINPISFCTVKPALRTTIEPSKLAFQITKTTIDQCCSRQLHRNLLLCGKTKRMNTALIDNLLLATACLIALLLTRFLKDRQTGLAAAFFLLFPPLLVFLNMWAHTIAVVVVNYKRYLSGSFQYSFRFYSLLLFGVVFLVVSGLNLAQAKKLIRGDASRKTILHWLNGGTAVLFLPLAAINPIALLPVLASVVSSITVLLQKPTQRLLVDNGGTTTWQNVKAPA